MFQMCSAAAHILSVIAFVGAPPSKITLHPSGTALFMRKKQNAHERKRTEDSWTTSFVLGLGDKRIERRAHFDVEGLLHHRLCHILS